VSGVQLYMDMQIAITFNKFIFSNYYQCQYINVMFDVTS
jgi:hypothetical protein